MFRKIKRIFNRSSENNEISYEEMNKMLKDGTAYLIDVKSNQEYKEEHINGAINIPLYNIKKEIENIVKNKDTSIIVYCSTGGRSRQAKKILNELGYKNVYVLL